MPFTPNPNVETVLLPQLRWWFDLLNQEYFGSRLRPARIEVCNPGSEAWAGRYHHPAHLILVSSRCLQNSFQDWLETLAHEMTHAWQYAHGRPGQNNHHNREFRDFLQRIGISSTEKGLDYAVGSPFIPFLRRRGVDARPWSKPVGRAE
jgi:predicted SprT family Zn-dependent metalloprotease